MGAWVCLCVCVCVWRTRTNALRRSVILLGAITTRRDLRSGATTRTLHSDAFCVRLGASRIVCVLLSEKALGTGAAIGHCVCVCLCMVEACGCGYTMTYGGGCGCALRIVLRKDFGNRI